MGELLERSFPKPLPELSTHFIGSANIVPLNIGDFACRYRRYKSFRQITSSRSGTTHGSFRPNHPSTNLNHFYPVAERVKTSAFRWRNAARSSRNSQHGKRLHQNPCNVKKESKIPLVKVLESLENFLKEVFKQGLGQSPKVLPPKHPAAEFRRVRLLRREIHGALVDRLDLEVDARRTLQLLNRAREHDTTNPLRIVQRFPHAA